MKGYRASRGIHTRKVGEDVDHNSNIPLSPWIHTVYVRP